MTAHDLIEEARFQAYLNTLKPKPRMRYLREVTNLLCVGDVIPLVPAEKIRVMAEARDLWSRRVPRLLSAGA